MSTGKLFWTDPYLTSFEAEVLAIEGQSAILDQTAFYARSGGQVGDSGTLNGLAVRDTTFLPNRDIQHHLDPTAQLSFGVGDIVRGELDWDRRYRIMRHHSLQHLVYLAFKTVQGEGDVRGGEITETKTRVDFAYHGDVQMDAITALVESLIDKDMQPKAWVDSDDPEYRYWQIEGYEPIPCGGTHVRATGEIGEVTLRRKSLGGQGVRLYAECRT